MILTLAITVYNRYEMLLESFARVIDDPRIDEVLISDDASDPEYWNKIKELPKFNPKIKVVRQLTNKGMSVNKRDAIFNSKNEWVLIGDSDNIFDKDYLDALESQYVFLENIIYCPSFAKPSFDYRLLDNKLLDIKNCKGYLLISAFNCLLNTCNYVVNKDKYLSIWKENKEMKGSDTIWFNYLWLKKGYSLFVVKDMHYFHRVHNQSGFMQDVDYNMKKAEEIKTLIMQL